jgi:hypothetical protein
MAVDTKEDRKEEQKGGVVAQRETKDLVVTPQAVVQSTFPEQMRQGFPGMVNRQVLYNSVSRSCDTPTGIPYARAVSQGSWDGGAVIGGTANGFLGITIMDPTLVNPTTSALGDCVYAQYTEMGILTQGEMFATAPVAVVAGDPVSFIAVDGTLTNTGGVVIPGARWKYTRATPGDLNAVQLGIQR